MLPSGLRGMRRAKGRGAEVKTVWILGAGFSRSLGGPLLGDLLSPSGQAGVESFYGDNGLLTSEAVTLVRNIVEHHEIDRKERGRTPFWNDAEDFLDQLDAAAARPGASKRFRVLLARGALGHELERADMTALRGAARRLIAAECCSFLEEANLDEERWLPYRTWARALSNSDAIVTFNYDRVLELLAGRHPSKFDVVDPADPENEDPGSQVFKLHGSVDWKRVADESVHYELTRDANYALTCTNAEEIGIATPGPSKQIAKWALKPLWDAALARLRSADAIVFVGYRFPPTDAEARHELLTAIETNNAKPEVPQHHLKIHIVLGPKLSDDVERLHRLVESVLLRAGRTQGRPVSGRRTFQIHAHRMYAEDFFTVWSPALLHGVGIQA